MLNPNFISLTDSVRIIGSIAIVRKMVKSGMVKPHKLSGHEIYYERSAIVEIKKIISISMTKEEIKSRLNCSHTYVAHRVRDGSLREIKNPLFGRKRRYLIEDVEKIEQKSKIRNMVDKKNQPIDNDKME
jgi:hypothetical protein